MEYKNQNEKGEYALFANGKQYGWSKAVRVSNGLVVEKLAPILQKMVEDAKKDNVNLTFSRSLATIDEQVKIRKAYVKDKSKVNDDNWIWNAPASQFYPLAAKPGWSAHHSGRATDFDVTGRPDSFKWLIKNAINYGFIRTIPSEIWHWELLNGAKQYSYVSENHPSWKV